MVPARHHSWQGRHGSGPVFAHPILKWNFVPFLAAFCNCFSQSANSSHTTSTRLRPCRATRTTNSDSASRKSAESFLALQPQEEIDEFSVPVDGGDLEGSALAGSSRNSRSRTSPFGLLSVELLLNVKLQGVLLGDGDGLARALFEWRALGKEKRIDADGLVTRQLAHVRLPALPARS